jgi:hypothetical protein
VNPRRRRLAKRRRRERRDQALYAAALASLDLDDFTDYDGIEYDDGADEDAMLWAITFDGPVGS